MQWCNRLYIGVALCTKPHTIYHLILFSLPIVARVGITQKTYTRFAPRNRPLADLLRIQDAGFPHPTPGPARTAPPRAAIDHKSYPVPGTVGPRYQAQQPCTLNPPGPSFAVPILVIDRKGPVLRPRAAVPEPRSILLATLGTGMLLTALFRP